MPDGFGELRSRHGHEFGEARGTRAVVFAPFMADDYFVDSDILETTRSINP